jgi:hypothetical protein
VISQSPIIAETPLQKAAVNQFAPDLVDQFK